MDAKAPQCKTCGRNIKRLCRECLIDGLGRSLEKLILDGLRATITDHGPITKFWVGSAAKRIKSRIRAHLQQRMERNNVGMKYTPRDTPPHREINVPGRDDFYRRMSQRRLRHPLSCATDSEIALMGDEAFDKAVQEEADGWFEGYDPSSYLWREPDTPHCSKCYRWERYPAGQRHFGYCYVRSCKHNCDCSHHATEVWMATAASAGD
jgi:hypothetical protein